MMKFNILMLAMALISFPAILCVEHRRYKRDNEDRETNKNHAKVVCDKLNLEIFEASNGFNCLCETGTYLLKEVDSYKHQPDERNCSSCLFDSGDPNHQWFIDYQNHESSCFKSYGAKHCDFFMNTHRVEGSRTENSRCECNPGYHSANKTGDVKAGCHKHSPCDKGFQPSHIGTQKEDTYCEICPNGTFSNVSSPTEKCIPFTQCGLKKLVAQGSMTHDNVCSNNETEFSTTVAPPQTKESQAPGNGLGTGGIVIAVVIFSLILISTLYCYKKKKCCFSANEDNRSRDIEEGENGDPVVDPSEDQNARDPLLLQQSSSPAINNSTSLSNGGTVEYIAMPPIQHNNDSQRLITHGDDAGSQSQNSRESSERIEGSSIDVPVPENAAGPINADAQPSEVQLENPTDENNTDDDVGSQSHNNQVASQQQSNGTVSGDPATENAAVPIVNNAQPSEDQLEYPPMEDDTDDDVGSQSHNNQDASQQQSNGTVSGDSATENTAEPNISNAQPSEGQLENPPDGNDTNGGVSSSQLPTEDRSVAAGNRMQTASNQPSNIADNQNDIPAGSIHATLLAQESEDLKTYINGSQSFTTPHERSEILNLLCDRSPKDAKTLLKKSLTNNEFAKSMLGVLPANERDTTLFALCHKLGLSDLALDDIEKENVERIRVREKAVERTIHGCGRALTPELIFKQDFKNKQGLKDTLFDEFAKQLKKLVDDTPIV